MQETSAIECGVLEESEVAEALDLINAVQPHAPWTAEHFQWQFRASPAGEAAIFKARGGGRLIALFCAVRAVVDVPGGTVMAGRPQDVMTHPEWRGRGLLHALTAMCSDWLSGQQMIGYTFPNERSQKSFLRNGWNGGVRAPWWRCSIEDAAKTRHESVAMSCAMYDERVTAIWESAAIKDAVQRDAAYLNWRYAKPGGRYEKLLLDDSTVLVLKKYGDTVHVCDLFAPAYSDPAIARGLLFARNRAADQGARTLTAWLPREHRHAAQFEKAGMAWDPNVERIFATLGRPLRYISHSDNDIF